MYVQDTEVKGRKQNCLQIGGWGILLEMRKIYCICVDDDM